MAAEKILVIAISNVRPEREVRKIPAKSTLLFTDEGTSPKIDVNNPNF
jgi:hypothetical protein